MAMFNKGDKVRVKDEDGPYSGRRGMAAVIVEVGPAPMTDPSLGPLGSSAPEDWVEINLEAEHWSPGSRRTWVPVRILEIA
ncbi:MAG: hypothetical protein HQ478_12470 [Chloroflexi bacterium]|nr:hypothetical protein [Chloroflexota bacterium]